MILYSTVRSKDYIRLIFMLETIILKYQYIIKDLLHLSSVNVYPREINFMLKKNKSIPLKS